MGPVSDPEKWILTSDQRLLSHVKVFNGNYGLIPDLNLNSA